MTTTKAVRTAAGYVAGGAALAALGYAALAGAAWTRYGHATRARRPEDQDPILDRFMPLYDIVERHHVRVAAPAAVTQAAAREMQLRDSCVVRAIFKGRELMLGAGEDSHPDAGPEPGIEPPPGLLPMALSLGWGVLADESGREVVLGAVTRPWEPNPVFRDLMPGEFAAFSEPGYVKIAWTLRADPAGDSGSIFRTETRAMATDIDARAKFRGYWALVSPGVALIRRAMLVSLKQEAERRVAPPATVAVPAS
jgi:hypothetical protein